MLQLRMGRKRQELMERLSQTRVKVERHKRT
jgi:hypothetical protein